VVVLPSGIEGQVSGLVSRIIGKGQAEHPFGIGTEGLHFFLGL
jgi:hypothetical protein